ncbi:FUSC family protein [Actinophytocola algeriensis]|uniref:Aromatic acid exporter family member 1 n=1 Tax=Actinophytocola algeriensis TaxID=1768010 RepID=A0A7W7Q1Q6_9PSEU|nr:aromatic acid exporter family protein [Actinophytocola algeriensis]MBB4905394.1 hypothetical protein [Actinophytocola algeriensis]MBE1472921.1 hypothetical protein [Actinophytocola algeriensis]
MVRVRVRRVPGLRTAKTTLAAVLSFVVADWIGTSDAPVLAPLTALLVIQVTMYDTVRESLQRVASVLAGVLVAVGVAAVVGLSWWSLGGVVAVSLVVGRLLRLGPQLLEMPISAMLVLAVGGDRDVADSRVYETLVGAAVGILVNLAIAPPLYLRPAGDAVRELSERIAGFSRDLAGGLRASWSRQDADHWLTEARTLNADVARADRVLGRAEAGARLNPRAASTRREQPRLRTALTGLERFQLSLREVCRALLDRTYFVPEEEQADAYPTEVRTALADFLGAAAAAVTTATEGGEVALADLERKRNRLSTLLMVDPHADEAAWQQHGALMAAVDRLRVEVEAAARQPEETWRPPPLTDRQRQAVRRMMRRRRRRA